MRDSTEIIKGLGVPVRQIRVTGGGVRSAFWRQMQADVYGQTITTLSAGEGPAYGAALLAGVGARVWKTVPEASSAGVDTSGKTPADRRAKSAYDARYRRYGRRYASLKDDFAAIAAIERRS